MNQDFIKICKSVRDKRLATTGSIEGACREVSLAIVYIACVSGIDCCLCFGRYVLTDEEHYWLRIGNMIYDPTASQFGDCVEVLVGYETELTQYEEHGYVFVNANDIKSLISTSK